MEASFPTAHKFMLRFEGGYSNHPADPGGVTLEGVIQTVYNTYRRSVGKPQKALTPGMRNTPEWIAERDFIYRNNYWHPPKCPQLNAGVDAAIYDYSVNSGIGRSQKVLQRLVGVAVDGVVGPATIAAANKRDPKQLVAAICDERERFLRQLKTWPTFGKGWLSRVNGVRDYASKLAVAPAAPVPVPVDTVVSDGKGMVPEPKATKAVVKSAGPVVVATEGVRAGGSWLEWVAGHPLETFMVAGVAVFAVFLALKALDKWRDRQQEAPVPNTPVVPVA